MAETFDFSAFENPRFTYRVPAAKAGDPPVEISLDFDKVGVDLNMAVPTLFKPTGEKYSAEEVAAKPELKDKMKTGLSLLMTHMSGTDTRPLPESIPSLDHLLLAVRKAFQLPAHCGFDITMAVFYAFLSEWGRRAEVKKNSLGSLDSPAATQEPPAPSSPASSPVEQAAAATVAQMTEATPTPQ